MKNRHDYTEERDADLLRAYKDEIRTLAVIDFSDACQAAACRPSRRFWISEERATKVVAAMLRGRRRVSQKPMRQAMYDEICRRVAAMQAASPDVPLADLVCRVVHSPAPSFYLTRGSARVIICRARKAARKAVRRRRDRF